MEKAKSKLKIKTLRNNSWKIFSEWTRRKWADWRGYVGCCCCGKQYLWNSGLIHAGHWIHDKLDFEPDNVNPQCRDCNLKWNKNTNTAYAIYMASKYGVDRMQYLRDIAFNKDCHDYRGNDYSRQLLEEIREKYKQKLSELK